MESRITKVRRFTQRMEVKLQLHICVLGLYLWNWTLTEFPVTKLTKDLKLDDKKVQNLLKERGCTTQSQGVYSLTPPLKARFRMRFGKGKSKKRK